MSRKHIIAGVLVASLTAIIVPIARQIYLQRTFFGHVQSVRDTIDSFQSRRPADVPEGQWKEAVSWTSNVICQDFFAPNREEFPGLIALAKGLEQKAKSPVDLNTLQWVWDQCESSCGGPRSYGIRFRNVKLLTKGTIDDDRISQLWSLDRCLYLDLSGTELTDKSIEYLSTLRNLTTLDIRDTQITEAGAERLREALPRCKVALFTADFEQ